MPTITDQNTNKDEKPDATDTTIASNFLINAIKTQDDSIRQIMSLTGLILGIYVTVVANKYGSLISPLNNTIFPLLVSIPISMWIFGILLAVKALHPTIPSWGELFIFKTTLIIPVNASMQDFLIAIIQEKHDHLAYATYLLVLGLITSAAVFMMH